MANYAGMTFGQTRFLRALRKASQQTRSNKDANNKATYCPRPETLRRWLEGPAF